MLKKITVAECDICGRIVPAKARNGQYNETDYGLPEGWITGKANPQFCICPDCDRALKAKPPRHGDGA